MKEEAERYYRSVKGNKSTVELMADFASQRLEEKESQLKEAVEQIKKHHTQGGCMIRLSDGTKQYVLSESDINSLTKLKD